MIERYSIQTLISNSSIEKLISEYVIDLSNCQIIATSARDILMSLKELCLIITRLQYPNGLNSVWVFSDMRVSI